MYGIYFEAFSVHGKFCFLQFYNIFAFSFGMNNCWTNCSHAYPCESSEKKGASEVKFVEEIMLLMLVGNKKQND